MMAWSRRRTLIAGVTLILAINAIALGGVAYNRSGTPESQLQLSERELKAPYGRFNRSENSGVELALMWRVPVDPDAHEPYYGYESWGGTPAWLNAVKLAALGFEALPEKRSASADYKWQRTKEVLLVLELGGPAAQQALERARQKAAEEGKLSEANPGNKEFERRNKSAKETLLHEERESSRLFAIDAGLDVATLRAQYPDRSRFLIVRGHVRPQYVTRNKQDQLSGHVSALSVRQINVPVEFQPVLEGAVPGNNKIRFSATVAWGQRLEPWLVDLRGVAKEK